MNKRFISTRLSPPLAFEKTFSISAPEKGEDEVGENEEEGVEGRNHIATLIHRHALKHFVPCLKVRIESICLA